MLQKELGESELTQLKNNYSRKKSKRIYRFVRVCYPADIRQGKSNLNRLRFFFLL